MKVEIVDDLGRLHTITSGDPELVGRWFAEKASILMSANTCINHPARIDTIWPETRQECELIPVAHEGLRFTEDSLLEFAKKILDVSAAVGERERAAR